jgi:hypothetical protein
VRDRRVAAVFRPPAFAFARENRIAAWVEPLYSDGNKEDGMNAPINIRASLLLCCLALLVQPSRALAQQNPAAAHDPQHDFDFEIGTWHTHLQRLQHPLTGSTTWLEYDGTSYIRKIWNGKANLVELEVDAPTGHIEGLSLRLYNPQSHQWSLNFANGAQGTMSIPTVGEFKNGRGEFYDQEPFNNRTILVRNVFENITAHSYRFEQGFSDDGGKTWEVNWIAVDTRIPDRDGAAAVAAAPASAATASPTQETAPQSSDNRQQLGDAWWTGPMLANNASTLPRGHFLLEPYLYDEISPHTNGFGSLTYIEYGLANRFTIGLIPTFGYNKSSDALSSSGVGVGDISVLAQYRLTQFHEQHKLPTISLMLEETFPSGKYDQLGARPSDGFGAGAYTTTLALNSQTYFWMSNGRILRMRLNATQSLSTYASVSGVSVYGTSQGFQGHAKPGASTFLVAAWEYSLTRNWVLALDATYRHINNTRITGNDPAQSPPDIQLNSGSSDAVGFAPALEYNWKPTIGVLVGTRIIALGHNTPSTITPAVAINYVH